MDELPGLPREPLSRWWAATLPDLAAGGTDWSASLVGGGLSNLTYRVALPAATVVLRRPPVTGALPSAHDMVREHRVQSALAGTAVPVPRMLALCTDDTVIGAPFYVMEAVDGAVLRSASDTSSLTSTDRACVARELVTTLAALHAVDPGSVDLADFGRGAGYCERQVARWREQWRRSATRELPVVTALFDRLAEAVPVQQRVSVVHGDYRLDNTVMALGPVDGPQLAAVLDWELSTTGDPLADLGTFLAYWDDSRRGADAAFPPLAGLCSGDGFPGADGLAEAYATASGLDLAALPYYRALAVAKLAVIMEGVHARYLTGRTAGPGYELAGPSVPVLAARAWELVR